MQTDRGRVVYLLVAFFPAIFTTTKEHSTTISVISPRISDYEVLVPSDSQNACKFP